MDTPEFSARLTDAPETPLVVSVPHAGVATDRFGESLSPALDVRCDADLHVDALYRDLPRGAFVVARLSRFVCDLNRDPDDVSHATVPDHPRPLARNRRGFVWEITTAGTLALSRPLSFPEWQDRAKIHAAYHAAIAAALARAKDRFGYALLLDGHSMPSRGRPEHDDPGDDRAEIVPGDRDGTSCAPSLSRHVQEFFTRRGFSVTPNAPYKGGFITEHHGRPADGIHAIQIEIRRDLYMDERTYETRPTGFARVRDALGALLRELEQHPHRG